MENFPSAATEEIKENDISPETEAVMEEFREKRIGILNRIMSEKKARIVETLGLLTPGTDVATLLASATRGETLNGKELDARSRFNYAAMAGFLTLSYALLATGQHKEAMEAKGMAATFSAMEFGPDFIKASVAMAKKKAPEMKAFMERTGEFIAGNPEFISLELHG